VKRLLRRRHWRAKWLVYVPVAFYIAWLMLRYRSATLYTAANPGIPTGGMTGESKAAILQKLASVEGAVAPFVLIDRELGPRERVRRARRWMARHRVPFPVVLKPDVGERGRAVKVIRTRRELVHRLVRPREAMILQRFAEGEEYGVYYRRAPGEARGRIVSIARTSYFEPSAFDTHDALFTDQRRLATPVLEERIENLGRAHPGFFVGRFDVCARTADGLSGGHFEVIELNGVSSEPTYIYDRSITLGEALRALSLHWRAAFQIGAANRAQGAALTPLPTLLRLIAREHAIHVASVFQRAGW
jgi:hypothetical protein